MKVNAAVLMRQLLNRSTETTGYALSLNSLKLHSLLVEGDSLVMDADANLKLIREIGRQLLLLRAPR